ncbi:MAG: hypothetical protein HXY43_25695 [Fischerella sp.]|jgi:hypothetical protein|uniref:hypothetical protein n=1 Tax=unclassified Fischerella TaxID=494603 RepID=UPI00047EF345|nr:MULTISPECIES: hypothetical protein [unclassified Fischerella]NWF62535.1 hypothetical protein [Fischerella sp.]
MSKSTDKLFLDAVKQVALPSCKKKSLVQRYLQNPFSIAWSKLTTLIKVVQSPQAEVLEDDQTKEYRSYTREQYLYHPFTDRIDPSLYYTIFYPHQRF